MKYLTTRQVVKMHAVLLARYGGEDGGGHRGPVNQGPQAAVQAVKNSYYETPEELAAAYAVYIVQGHVFMDGNKRTGAAAMRTFLELNDTRMGLPAQDWRRMVELQERAERGEATGPLIAWLAALIRA